MLGVLGDGHGVDKDQRTGAGQQRLDFVFGFILFGARCRNIDVARPSNGHAGLASRDVVDHRGTEQAHVLADPGQHIGRRLVIGRIVRVRVLANIVQRHRDDLCRGVQVSNAAGLEFAGVFGIKDQVPGVFRHRHVPERLHGTGLVDAHRGEAPGPGHQMLVVRICLLQGGHEGGIEIGKVGNLGLVE